ncbi:MAG TPA: hypothetical protein VF182_03620 [Candidatus Binatia bacterium]
MQSAHAPAEEIMKDDIADKPHVTDAQLSLLEQHYELKPRLEFRREVSRGKPLTVGPAARLSKGVTWQGLAQMSTTRFANGSVNVKTANSIRAVQGG